MGSHNSIFSPQSHHPRIEIESRTLNPGTTKPQLYPQATTTSKEPNFFPCAHVSCLCVTIITRNSWEYSALKQPLDHTILPQLSRILELERDKVMC